MRHTPRRIVRRAPLPLAAGVAVAALMALGLPSGLATAATVGTGDCTSSVGDGLTAQASSMQVSPTMFRCTVAFTAGTGAWTVPAGVSSAEVELVGGGGGGGNFGGGGGGAVVPKTTVTVTSGASVSVTVGAGGIGGDAVTGATNGGDSVFGDVVALGGGYGGSSALGQAVGGNGGDGGNGGGGAPGTTTSGVEGASLAASPAMGHSGGAGAYFSSTDPMQALTPPLSSPNTYLAGGGGGGANSGVLPPSSDPSGLGGAGRVPTAGSLGATITGGKGGLGVNTVGDGTLVPLYQPGYGAGGCGGASAYGSPLGTSTVVSPGCLEAGAFSYADHATPSGAIPSAPANTGRGGGGGGDYGQVGGDGGSGFIYVYWFSADGGGSGGAPGAPTGVTPNGGNGSADVGWTPPANDGGSEITDYGVEFSSDGGTIWNPASMCTGAATRCVVTGLTNGVGYAFRVSATNVNGTGPWSDPSATVTPNSDPSATPDGMVIPRFTG